MVGNFCANFMKNGIFCLYTIYKLHCKQLTYFLVALCFFSHSLYHQSYYVCKQVFPRMQCFVVEVAHLGKRVRILWSKKLKHKINMNDTKLFKICLLSLNDAVVSHWLIDTATTSYKRQLEKLQKNESSQQWEI